MAESEGVVVLGASGHAKVVISAIRAGGGTVLCVLDDDADKWGMEFRGLTILGPVSEIARFPDASVVAAIGDNRARADLVARLPQVRWGEVVHPAAWVDPSARRGPGSVVFAGAVLQADSRIGAHAIVNTCASVDHDCEVGAFAHLAPGVRLAGDVHVGDGAFLGIGTSTIPGIRIGAWATVGAGAAVVRNVAAGVTVKGVPARVGGASPAKVG